MSQPEIFVRPQGLYLILRQGKEWCNGKSAGNEGRLLRRVDAPVFQLRQLVPQGAGNSPEVTAGPVNPVAAGAFVEPAVVQEDML